MPKLLVCVGFALAVATQAGAQETTADARARLIADLERLMMTGEPHQTSADDGQLLQLAVTDAISSGDTEIERLAVRAATPLFARVSNVLIKVGQPASIGIGTRHVLELPRPLPFESLIYMSVDGRDYAEAGTLNSGEGSWITATLRDYALGPGVHHVRVRARITFGSPKSQRFTEERQLPDIGYAVYDPREPATGVARLLLAPATISAAALDRSLPDVPTGTWLAGVLERVGAKRPVDWMMHYCVERTRKIVSPPVGGGDLCAVAYFEAKGDIFRAWFRTGSMRLTEAGPAWTIDRPSFEGIATSQSGTALATLSALPALLDAPRQSWPTADLEIAPADVIIETARAHRAIITVTVRNNGPVDVHGAQVIVSAGSDPEGRITARTVTVDVPGHGSTDIRIETGLASPYGFVVAQATQMSDESPHDTWTVDPTPLDACAFRIFNANLAPARYARTIANSSGCAGW